MIISNIEYHKYYFRLYITNKSSSFSLSSSNIQISNKIAIKNIIFFYLKSIYLYWNFWKFFYENRIFPSPLYSYLTIIFDWSWNNFNFCKCLWFFLIIIICRNINRKRISSCFSDHGYRRVKSNIWFKSSLKTHDRSDVMYYRILLANSIMHKWKIYTDK